MEYRCSYNTSTMHGRFPCFQRILQYGNYRRTTAHLPLRTLLHHDLHREGSIFLCLEANRQSFTGPQGHRFFLGHGKLSIISRIPRNSIKGQLPSFTCYLTPRCACDIERSIRRCSPRHASHFRTSPLSLGSCAWVFSTGIDRSLRGTAFIR
ncbi:hypothetical protein K439DRAFT_981212 [Ramaria rubella]|nr:hypothetical protein K439DRAFT_981212 [Ramaria rubella]